MLPPGTTEAENDPVYQAGMLLAQTWEVIEEVLAGKVPKDEIVKSLRKAQETVRTVVTLLKEAD